MFFGGTTSRRLLSRAGSLLLAGGILWLVGFHALLLWRRVADASIVRPGVLARWIAAALLIAGLVALQRRATAQLRGRHATLILWLLVAMLHIGPADQSLLDGNHFATLVQTGFALAQIALLGFAFLFGIRAAGYRKLLAVAPGSIALSAGTLATSSSPRAPPAH